MRVHGIARGSLLAVLAAVALAGCSSRHPAPIVHRQPLPVEPSVAPVATAPAATLPPVQEPVIEGPIVESVTTPGRSGGIEARPLPGSQQGATPQPLAPGASAPGASVRTEPSAAKLPYSAETLARLQRTAPAPAPAASPAPGDGKLVSSAGKPSARGFIWPASGAVIQGFAEPRSMGVSIAGQPGDPVVAAADGRVIFSGTGPPGYGNLLIVKHDDDTLSVYAHNRALLVKENSNVKRGQRIAELGSSGTDRPKLHFEIRRQGKPVDPSAYLPAR
ncbi:MAG: peptidoglycan DD-metalloendopeptidase family protein [Burkholderiaceae bacterium]